MEYALLIALALGVLLMVLAWLMITIAGFRHHFVTGVVAMIPVVNLLILPTVWHRTKGWFFTGLVGLILTLGAWIGGANSQAGQHLQKLLGSHWWAPADNSLPRSTTTRADQEPPQTVTQTVNMSLPVAPITPPTESQSTNTNQATTVITPTGASAQHELPSSALYQMTFQPIELSGANQYVGQSVRILRKDQKRVEGRLLGVTDKTLRIEQNLNGAVAPQEIETKYIQVIEVLKN
jgi:hypothetical protein